MAELKDKKCIVCGAWVAWEGRLPCACAEHRYHEVFEAYDKARLTKRAADGAICPCCQSNNTFEAVICVNCGAHTAPRR